MNTKFKVTALLVVCVIFTVCLCTGGSSSAVAQRALSYSSRSESNRALLTSAHSTKPNLQRSRREIIMNAFVPTNFYGRIDVNRKCIVPSWVTEIQLDWHLFFKNNGCFDASILKNFGLKEDKATELGGEIDTVITEFKALELAHSKLVSNSEDEFIHVSDFFVFSAPIIERLKEKVLEYFTEFNDDRGYIFLSRLSLAPEFADNGVFGKDIAFVELTAADGSPGFSFSIKPSGPPATLPPYPTFSSGSYANAFGLQRYGHLFQHYINQSSKD
jgi:hypothetical protein